MSSRIHRPNSQPLVVFDWWLFVPMCPGKHTKSYWTWSIYSGITHWKWWFSIVMLVYQRVVGCWASSPAWLLAIHQLCCLVMVSITTLAEPTCVHQIQVSMKLNKASDVGHCLHQSLQMSTAMHLQCTVRTVPFQHLPTKIGPAIPIPLPKSKEHLPNEPYPFLVIPWPGGAPAPVRLGRFLRSRWCGGCHQH